MTRDEIPHGRGLCCAPGHQQPWAGPQAATRCPERSARYGAGAHSLTPLAGARRASIDSCAPEASRGRTESGAEASASSLPAGDMGKLQHLAPLTARRQETPPPSQAKHADRIVPAEGISGTWTPMKSPQLMLYAQGIDVNFKAWGLGATLLFFLLSGMEV